MEPVNVQTDSAEVCGLQGGHSTDSVSTLHCTSAIHTPTENNNGQWSFFGNYTLIAAIANTAVNLCNIEVLVCLKTFLNVISLNNLVFK